MNKNGLGITLLLLPIVIIAFFGLSTWQASKNYDKPRQYVHFIALGEDGSNCSGVAIAPELVLTAFHCTGVPDVKNPLKIKVSGKEATVIRYDNKEDLSLLKVPGLECPCAPLAASSPETDREVLAVGWSLGKAEVATVGHAQALVEGYDDTYKLLATAPIAFGNSGGGLFVFNYIMGRWELTGLTVQVAGANLGFMGIPVFHMTLVTPIESVWHFLHRS